MYGVGHEEPTPTNSGQTWIRFENNVQLISLFWTWHYFEHDVYSTYSQKNSRISSGTIESFKVALLTFSQPAEHYPSDLELFQRPIANARGHFVRMSPPNVTWPRREVAVKVIDDGPSWGFNDAAKRSWLD